MSKQNLVKILIVLIVLVVLKVIFPFDRYSKDDMVLSFVMTKNDVEEPIYSIKFSSTSNNDTKYGFAPKANNCGGNFFKGKTEENIGSIYYNDNDNVIIVSYDTRHEIEFDIKDIQYNRVYTSDGTNISVPYVIKPGKGEISITLK